MSCPRGCQAICRHSLITQIDSVLIRSQYRYVLWKTLWFLSYLYECDLHCACWCPASVDARPSADTVLITQIDSVLIRSQYRYVLWKTLWFLSYLFECDLHCACWCPAPVDARPSADTVLITQIDSVFEKVSVSVCTLEDIVVPVLFVWVWASLCLLMSCLRGCQAICRHSADHPNRQCFDKVSVSVCTLEDIVVPVLFVWVWSSLCLLMSCLHGCQTICRHSADHLNRQCFDKVSVSVCTLEDIVVPVLFVWVWSSLCLLMSCPRGCQAICRHSAGHPIWIMICQVFSIRMYFGRHCGSCFMLMNVIFTVPFDVLPPWMPGHLQTQCW